MILGFKDQFVPFVENGSKTHTIRAGARWKAGMRADLFARPRQRDMRLLFRAPVVRVEAITITNCGVYICHDDFGVPVKLSKDEAELFAFRDGFRFDPNGGGSFALMMSFWKRTHKLPFHGQIVHWDYKQRFMDIRETCFRESERRAKGVRP